MNRSRWLPLILVFAVGLAGGLYYAWVVNPVEYVDSAPASLRQPYRDSYLTLIAAAYAQTGDLARAQARLSLFDDPHLTDTLAALAQRELASGGSEADAKALAQLAAAISQQSTPSRPAASTRPPIPSRATGTATRRPTPSTTPIPTHTPAPSATPGAPFQLKSQDQVCDTKLGEPLIQVEIEDAAGKPVPGIEVLVVWDSGQDHFFTGLKPELGLGYGDFTMTPGTTYTVQLADSASPITGLQAPSCTASDGSTFTGSWLLTFSQPEQ